MACRAYVRGAVSLARRGGEGELRDGEDISAAVKDAAVHDAFLVVEDSHADGLAGEPLDVLCRVALLDSDEHEQSLAYR